MRQGSSQSQPLTSSQSQALSQTDTDEADNECKDDQVALWEANDLPAQPNAGQNFSVGDRNCSINSFGTKPAAIWFSILKSIKLVDESVCLPDLALSQMIIISPEAAAETCSLGLCECMSLLIINIVHRNSAASGG